MSIIVLRPNGAGYQTDLYREGGSANWDVVKDAIPNDGTYVYKGGSSSGIDLYDLPSSELEEGTINSVKVYFRIHPTTNYGSTGIFANPYVRTEDSNYKGGGNNDYKGGSGWNTYSYEWTTNPNTSLQWTWDQINALEAGIYLYSNNGAYYMQCSQIYVEIDYTPVVSKNSNFLLVM